MLKEQSEALTTCLEVGQIFAALLLGFQEFVGAEFLFANPQKSAKPSPSHGPCGCHGPLLISGIYLSFYLFLFTACWGYLALVSFVKLSLYSFLL